MVTTLESKIMAAYEHGRMDFLAGATCVPTIPPAFCSGLSSLHKNLVRSCWVDGWLYESLTETPQEEER